MNRNVVLALAGLAALLALVLTDKLAAEALVTYIVGLAQPRPEIPGAADPA